MTRGADRRSVLTGLGALGVMGCSPLVAETLDFSRAMSALEARHGGRLGLAAWSAGDAVAYAPDARFLYCSTFKLFLAAATLQRADRRQERLDRVVPVTAADIKGHSPVTETFVGRAMTIEALCQATVEVSDNGAANILIREFGGLDAWRQWYRSIGDDTTNVDRWELELNRPDGDKDTTTPRRTVANLQAVFREPDQRMAVADPARPFAGALLSPARLALLEGWLVASPTGPDRIKGGVGPGMAVAHKTGTSGTGHVNDIGVIRPLVGAPIFIAVYVEARAATPAQRDAVIADATRIALAALGHGAAA